MIYNPVRHWCCVHVAELRQVLVTQARLPGTYRRMRYGQHNFILNEWAAVIYTGIHP